MFHYRIVWIENIAELIQKYFSKWKWGKNHSWVQFNQSKMENNKQKKLENNFFKFQSTHCTNWWMKNKSNVEQVDK